MRYIFVSLFLFFFFGLYAQNGNSDFGDRVGEDNNEDETSTNDSLVVNQRDTLSDIIYSFSLDNLSQNEYASDSTLTDFEEYEMTNQMEMPYITLGNPGSSAYPLFWEKKYNRGFSLGLTQYNPYQLTNENIRFYNLEKPYSKVYFSPGATQSSFRSSAVLARDFANNTKVSLHFNRINSQSIYEHSENRHTYIQVGVFQKQDSSKFAYAVNFLSNSNYEEFNGGIVNEADLYEEGGQIRSSISTLVSTPAQYNLSRNFDGRLYYFIAEKDSSQQYVQLKLGYDNGLYKFVNSGVSLNDTLLFSEGFITSPLGMRRHVNNNEYSSRISYHLENKRFRSFYYLKYGVNHIKTTTSSKFIQTALVGTENQFDWKGLRVNLDGYVGTSYRTFVLDLHPYLRFRYKDFADISAGFRLHTEPSPYLQNEIEITQTIIKEDPAFTLSSQELYGMAAIPAIGLTARVSSFAGQNIPVLSSDGLTIDRENITYLTVDIEEKLKYRWFRFNNRFITQIRNKSVYNMPQFYTEHELYFEGKLFGSLFFNAGLNGNYIPAYSLPAFSPFYGRFYVNTEANPRSFYRIDPFASIKVQGFRFFVKYEYLNGLWDNSVIFQALNYPQLDSRLRLGVSWELRN